MLYEVITKILGNKNYAGCALLAVQVGQQLGAQVARGYFAYFAGHVDLPVFVDLKFQVAAGHPDGELAVGEAFLDHHGRYGARRAPRSYNFV